MFLTCADPLFGEAMACCLQLFPQVRPMITMCPRTDTHLTYMTNITLNTEFVVPPRGAW